jgi:hypothetical protein
MQLSQVMRAALVALSMLALLGAARIIAPSAKADTVVTIEYFDGALSPYGYWVDDPDYGRVWRPTRVPDDWGPYTRGGWVYTRDYGWVWVSDEPYGWVVYHYGHWAWTDRWGWVWVAGYDWAPAWVEWCYGGGYVSCEPMPPDPYWQGAYYYGSYDCTSPTYYSHAVFVSETYFGRPGMSSHYEPRSRNATIAASASVNVTSYVRGSVGITNRGVDIRKLEAATGQPISVLPVVQSKAPIAGGLGRDMKELRIFRPEVAGLPTPKLGVPSTAKSLYQQPDLPPPVAKPFDGRDTGSILGPVDSSRGTPLDTNSAASMPDLGGIGRSLPSPGSGLGGVRGVLGR